MFILFFQLNQIPATDHQKEINGFIEKSPIYVTSLNASDYNSTIVNTVAKTTEQIRPETAETRVKIEESVSNHQLNEDLEVTSELELKQEINEERTTQVFDQPRTSICVSDRRSSSPFTNGRTEVLIGQDGSSSLRTTAIVEHNRLSVEDSEVLLR